MSKQYIPIPEEDIPCRVCGAYWACDHKPPSLGRRPRHGEAAIWVDRNYNKRDNTGKIVRPASVRVERRRHEALRLGLLLPETPAEAELYEAGLAKRETEREAATC